MLLVYFGKLVAGQPMYLKPEAIFMWETFISRQTHTFHAEVTNILSCNHLLGLSASLAFILFSFVSIIVVWVMLYITHSNQEWKQVFATKWTYTKSNNWVN